MEHCSDHEKMVDIWHNIDKTTIALSVRINGSIHDIERHIEQGQAWRVGILGVAITLILQTVALAMMWGALCKTVEVNTHRIDTIEELHPRIAIK